MRVALVYDRVNKFGGAERVLLALHEIWPDAPLYTAVYNPKGASWAKVFKIIPSFLQNFPLAKTHHEFYPFLMPLAFESFNLDRFEVIISVTSEFAKGILTKPYTLHICYCLTPTRYLWSGYWEYFCHPVLRSLAQPFVSYLRKWDQIASQRPDEYIAISKTVQKRIRKYYRRDSVVIYPPVDTERFQPPQNLKTQTPKYFLIVSRLVPYKRIEIAIRCFNKLRLPLIIIGDGVERKKLEKIALPNIRFLGQNLTDKEVLRYYQNCQALIFPGEEDFGLVAVEAQACGKPVIAFKRGGVEEAVIEGRTGEFFYPQTPEVLARAVLKFKQRKYRPRACRENAVKFDKEIFKKKFKKLVEKIWTKHKKNL